MSNTNENVGQKGEHNAKLHKRAVKHASAVVRVPCACRGVLALVLVLLLFCIAFFVTIHAWYAVPRALSASASDSLFSGERAREHLVQLAGPAVVGSRRAEANAAFIERKLSAMIRSGGCSTTCERLNAADDLTKTLGLRALVERQWGNGSFEMDFSQLGEQSITNAYTNISNIILRLEPLVATNDTATSASAFVCPKSIVVNSHYDTAPGSPGASDALAPIAVMLELVRLILYTNRQYYVAHGTPWLRAPLVFLFNGAEEAILLGSHAFVSGHPTINSTAMLLNLESAGAGIGPELLFRYDTRSPWLMKLYADAVPHPHTGSYVQDIFERNLIPAETDYRMFSETAGVTGVDLAFHLHGYTYHTRYDVPSRVDVGSIQHMGDNVWALLRMAAHERAESVCSEVSVPQHPEDGARKDPEPLAFFDILSAKVFYFNHRKAYRVYMAMAGILVLLIWQPSRCFTRRNRRAGATAEPALDDATPSQFRAVLAVLLGAATGFLTALALASIMSFLLPGPKPPMIWYGRHMLVLPCLYGAPAVAIALVVAGRLLDPKHAAHHIAMPENPIPRFERIERAVAVYFMALALLLGFWIELTMVYLWAFQASVHILGSIIAWPWRHTSRPMVYVFLRFFCFAVATQLIHLPPVLMTLETFAPLMGMAGSSARVEFAVAALTAYLAIHWGYMLWLPLLSIRKAWMRGAIRLALAVFLVGGVALLVPHWLGAVPYSPQAPKRLVIQHMCAQQPLQVHVEQRARASAPAQMASAPQVCLVGIAGLDPYPLERVLPKARFQHCEPNRFTWGYRSKRSIFANVAPLEKLVHHAGIQCPEDSFGAGVLESVAMPRLLVKEDALVECVPPAHLPRAEAADNATLVCRALTLEIQALRAHWSALVFDAAVRQWSLTADAPNQGQTRRHFIRHVAGHGTPHIWNMSLIVERNNTEPAVVFDVMATRYGENRSELSPSLWSNALPDWTAPVYMTSKFATYVV
jgi:hypothetical protein